MGFCKNVLSKKENISRVIKSFFINKGPCLLEVKIKQGSMNNLSRPKNLIKIKKEFMSKLI